jgi:hypothetical protein
MTSGPGWLQLSGLTRNRVRFIQFSGIEKNASQIAVRYGR